MHEDWVSLRQILDHAREAVALIKGRDRSALDRDRVLTLALVQLLQILGEAARRVSDPKRQRHPEIAWSQIIGLRNRLIHGYDRINLDIVWQIVSFDLPELIAALEKIVNGYQPDA